MGRSFWLTGGVRACLHADPTSPIGTGVVLVPPFGWEDLSSYRVRREWAESLSRKGHPTMRLDLPGTGESAAPGVGSLLDAWRAAVVDAAATLRIAAGCARVAAIGLGLGGFPAFLAGGSASVDDVALWAVPTRGRVGVRALRAFAGLSDPGELDADDAERLWVAGYSLPLTALTELDAIDLADSDSLALRPGHRVLVIGRDGADADARLVAALHASGVAVTALTGSGYAAAVAHPQTAVTAKAVASAVLQWLDAGGEPVAAPVYRWTPAVRASLDHGVSERFVDLQTPLGDFAAVVTEPAEAAAPVDLTMVLFNAAATRRIGPNGLWVQAAENAAARGVTVVRWDLPGVGDSEGSADWTADNAAFYEADVIAQVRAALESIVDLRLPGRLLLVGLCSGAYWSFVVAQDDKRVVGSLLLNPVALHWDAAAASVVHGRELARLFQPATWRRILTGQVSGRRARAVLRTAVHFVAQAPAAWESRRERSRSTGVRSVGEMDPIARSLDRLAASDQRVTIVFGREQPLYAELLGKGYVGDMRRWPNLDIQLLGGPPGVNTSFAPPSLQREVLLAVDDAVSASLP